MKLVLLPSILVFAMGVLYVGKVSSAFSPGSHLMHTRQSLLFSRKLATKSPGYGMSQVSRTHSVLMVNLSSEPSDNNEDQSTVSRRAVANSMLAALAFCLEPNTPSHAYEKTFPMDLDFENGDTSKNLETIRAAKIKDKKAKSKASMDYVSSSNPLFFRDINDLLSCFVWGGALWLLSGSRSNPLVTPLANVLYDEDNQPWLKDRNEGLFGPLPTPFFLVLGVLFFFVGITVDRLVLFAAEGDSNVCLQLAGVSLIGGGALELGRLASGEKKKSRADFDRDIRLEQEFAEFAQNRLIRGGNCHRSEVVSAFRRYFAKYRQSDSTDYPLTDLEIERLLRNWNRNMGNTDMSSAGFFTGIQINDQADVFVNR